MEKVPEDSKDAASSPDPMQAPADAFRSGSEQRGGKTSVQHKQDNAAAKPSVNTKSNFSNDAPQREKTAENTMLVSINDRKVKVGADFDSTSLYTLCRRWLRNDAPRKEQPGVQSLAKLLPKPLPPKKVSNDNFSAEENESKDALEDYLDGESEAPSEQVLENHIKHFKNVGKRLREQQRQRIDRYKLRLALLLQATPYQEKLDASLHY